MLHHALRRPPARVSTPSSWSLTRSAGSAAAKRSRQPLDAPSPPSSAPSPRRPRCDELAKLEQAAHRLAFRSIPYGSPANVLFPPSSTVPQFTTANKYFQLRCFPSQSRYLPLDRGEEGSRHPHPHPHPPALSLNKSLPTPPPSLLGTTDPNPHRPSPFLNSPSERRQRSAQSARLRKPYTVDLTLLASKKKVHKSAVVRERCKRRCREAVRLVVVRNASARSELQGGRGRQEGLVLHEENVRETGPRKWLLPGYHYIMNITLETYRGPLPDLVTSLREALKTLKTKAEAAALAARLADIEIAPRTRLPDPVASE